VTHSSLRLQGGRWPLPKLVSDVYLRATECADPERRLARVEELLAKADKDSDSTNGGRRDAPAKPNGNWKDPKQSN
jgi:hypothetical protein